MSPPEQTRPIGGLLGTQGLRLGRKLAAGDLQRLILGPLSQRPHHGYEIIKALEACSCGYYVPSPGVVYPALVLLQRAGHTRMQTEGSRKRHSLTATGDAQYALQREAIQTLFAHLRRAGERLEHLRHALGSASLPSCGVPPRTSAAAERPPDMAVERQPATLSMAGVITAEAWPAANAPAAPGARQIAHSRA